MTNVIKSSLDTLPTPVPIPLLGDLRRLTNRLVKLNSIEPLWEIDVAPSDNVRQSLQARLARIANWLAPAGPENTLKELMKLFATMAIRAASEHERKLASAVYVEDLMDLPLFALAAACKAFRAGQAGGGTWAPTQAEIRIEAVKAMAPIVKERREIEAVLNAKVRIPEDSAERRRAVVAAALGKLKTMRDAGREAEEERNQRAKKESDFRKAETAAELEARLKSPMPKLDPTILRQFGIRENREAAE